MPNSVRVGKRKPSIFPNAQRATVIARTATILATATFTKFQHEASCRHGLRRGLVVRGFGWAIADDEAARIVSAALDAIGAVRPTWWQGQPEYAHVRERCLWCYGPIEHGRLFCSPDCARSSKERRAYRQHKETRFIEDSATYIVTRADAPGRPCEQCRETFFSAEPAQRYCSLGCAHAARRAPDLNKTCPICRDRFRAQRVEIETCSHACAAELARRRSPERTCPECLEPFHGVHNSKFCSRTCRSRAANRASYARRKARDPTPA